MMTLFLSIVCAVPPALTCPTPVADVGEVRSGPPLVQSFQLTNPLRDRAIHITGLMCGCLRRDLGQERLAPGESTELRVAVNTLTQPEGPNTWRVSVRYRLEPRAGEPEPEMVEYKLDLTVVAKLVREISVTPPAVAFSTTGAAQQTLIVTDRRDRPLTVTHARTTSPHLTATLGETRTEEGEHHQALALALAASMPVGDTQETVVLTTNDPACPELRVPVTVHRRAAHGVTASPAQVELVLASGVPASRLVQFRAGGQPVRIQAVESSHPAITTKWASPGGPVATLRVTLPATFSGEAGETAGTAGEAMIRVTFTEPAHAEVRIPIRWSNRP
ncbi:MAG: DUF1573 domain-containing protein [Bacteroidales bacterium]|nr:DUF1573 domain-containing protein [Bacteroidales bacterium]